MQIQDIYSQYSTTNLLPNMNFTTWMWSAFNLAWNYYKFNTSDSTEEADNKALLNDFGMVWFDIYTSANLLTKQIHTNE